MNAAKSLNASRFMIRLFLMEFAQGMKKLSLINGETVTFATQRGLACRMILLFLANYAKKEIT